MIQLEILEKIRRNILSKVSRLFETYLAEVWTHFAHLRNPQRFDQSSSSFQIEMESCAWKLCYFRPFKAEYKPTNEFFFFFITNCFDQSCRYWTSFILEVWIIGNIFWQYFQDQKLCNDFIYKACIWIYLCSTAYCIAIPVTNIDLVSINILIVFIYCILEIFISSLLFAVNVKKAQNRS